MNKHKVLAEILETSYECMENDWDGYGADKITGKGIHAVTFFLEKLPIDLLTPEVSADPHGHLTLEWYSSPKNLLSITIGYEEIYFVFCYEGEDMVGTLDLTEDAATTMGNLSRLVSSVPLET